MCVLIGISPGLLERPAELPARYDEQVSRLDPCRGTRIEAGLSVLLRLTGENFGERTVNDIVLVLGEGRIRQQAHARADGVT